MRTLHWYLGRLSKIYRKWYWRTHDYQYMWGIQRFVKDDFPATKSDIDISYSDILPRLVQEELKRTEPKSITDKMNENLKILNECDMLLRYEDSPKKRYSLLKKRMEAINKLRRGPSKTLIQKILGG
jgi:hypothetical protein